jgi:hypothetical protein
MPECCAALAGGMAAYVAADVFIGNSGNAAVFGHHANVNGGTAMRSLFICCIAASRHLAGCPGKTGPASAQYR